MILSNQVSVNFDAIKSRATPHDVAIALEDLMCDDCSGSGIKKDKTKRPVYQRCPKCSGTGWSGKELRL